MINAYVIMGFISIIGLIGIYYSLDYLKTKKQEQK